MEGISVKAFRGLKSYWKKRGYERLGVSDRRSSDAVEEASTSSRRRRRFSWRIKIKPRVKLQKLIRAPKSFLIWLRDAYVKMMMRFANSRVCSAASYGGTGVGTFGIRPLKEYDQKLIVEIYKSVLLSQAAKEAAENNRTLCRIQEQLDCSPSGTA